MSVGGGMRNFTYILVSALCCISLVNQVSLSKDKALLFDNIPEIEEPTTLKARVGKKPEVLIVLYMAARNDLFPFAGRNIKQLQAVGSDERIKIFIRFDLQKPDQPCITKHFFIEQNKVMQLGSDLSMDSGDEKSLIYTVQCAYERFPADELVLILWNHGTGGIEPDIQKVINPSELFLYNPKKGLVEINRSINFLDYISQGETAYNETKGICFDDSSGNYLTIEKLTNALRVISTEILKKKIKILACDACLMAGADVFIGFEPFVHYFVGSQEAELGAGYRYDILLEPLLKNKMHCNADLARHFVFAYKEAYGKVSQDYTHSAIDLTNIDEFGSTIDKLAGSLLMGLEQQKGKSVKEAIRLSRHKNHCTRFIEQSYIDFGHFCSNLQKNLSKCELLTSSGTSEFKADVSAQLTKIKKIMGTVVIANAVGKNLQHATGVSIYFPEFIIHKSYHRNAFACNNNWLPFLKKYHAVR